jgi:MFS family permease
MIYSAGSLFGRIIPAHFDDVFGHFNMMTFVSALTGLSILCLWLPLDTHPSHAGLMVFGVVYGVVSGACVSMLMPCAAKSASLETLGVQFGTFQSVIGIA